MIDLRKLFTATLLVSLLAACLSPSAARRRCGSSLDNWKACSAGYCARCACIVELVSKHHSVPTSDEVEQLVPSVEAGGECQTDLAISVLSSLSGGDLEDMMRAISASAGHSPLVFLKVLKKHQVGERRITLIVRMLPLSSVDNKTEKRRIVRERIAALRGVSDAQVREVRDLAIAALTKFEKDLH